MQVTSILKETEPWDLPNKTIRIFYPRQHDDTVAFYWICRYYSGSFLSRKASLLREHPLGRYICIVVRGRQKNPEFIMVFLQLWKSVIWGQARDDCRRRGCESDRPPSQLINFIKQNFTSIYYSKYTVYTNCLLVGNMEIFKLHPFHIRKSRPIFYY